MKIFEQLNENQNWEIACQGLNQFNIAEGEITSLIGSIGLSYFDSLEEKIKRKGSLIEDDLMYSYYFIGENDNKYKIEFYFNADLDYEITQEESSHLRDLDIKGEEEKGIINVENITITDIMLVSVKDEDDEPFWEINYDDPEWEDFFNWCIKGFDEFENITQFIKEELEDILNQ